VGFQMIDEELKKITKDSVRKIAAENIEAIKNSNRRDFRF
jgi:2-iminoacetate synthase